MRQSSIFLIGPMGAGKTAVGRKLAGHLGLDFVDTDALIQERTGVDIPYIFEKEGEDGFRLREQAVIEEMTAVPDIVMATGGGAVTVKANRQALGARGFVVYLFATVRQQVERTRFGRHRPLLDNCDPADRLAALFQQRDPLYREIADLVVETDGCRVAEVVRTVVDALSEEPESKG